MRKTMKMILTVLRAKYNEVRTLGRGLYLVRGAERFSWWGVYSTKNMDVICWGDRYKTMSPDLISFERIITNTCGGYRIEEVLFSIQKQRTVAFKGYRGYSLELGERGLIKGLFIKVGGSGIGLGVFDALREVFVVKPEYDELISLESSQYYGTKKNHQTGRCTYFLINVNEKGKATTQETSKIA